MRNQGDCVSLSLFLNISFLFSPFISPSFFFFNLSFSLLLSFSMEFCSVSISLQVSAVSSPYKNWFFFSSFFVHMVDTSITTRSIKCQVRNKKWLRAMNPNSGFQRYRISLTQLRSCMQSTLTREEYSEDEDRCWAAILKSKLQPGSFWHYVKNGLQKVIMETGRTIRTLLHLLIFVVWVSEAVVEVVKSWIFLKVDLAGFATCFCSKGSPETD